MKSGVFIRNEREEFRNGDTEGGRQCEDKRQGLELCRHKPRSAWGPPNLEEARKDPVVRAFRGTRPLLT